MLIKAQRLSFALFALFLVGITTSLGVWQLHRLTWKNAILETLNHNLLTPVSSYESLDWTSNAKNLEGHRVIIHGELQDNDVYYLINQRYNGRLGYRPLQRIHLSHGVDIYVLRPWTDQKTPHQKSLLTLHGVVRKSQNRPSFFMPGTDLSRHEILAVHVRDLPPSNHPLIQTYYIDERSDIEESDFKKRFMSTLNIQNNHASYAFTWFSLSIALLLMTFLTLKSNKKNK